MIILGLGTVWILDGLEGTIIAKLVGTGKVPDTVIAFLIGASLMILAGLVEVIFGVKTERQSLENIARPLTAEDADSGSGSGSGSAARGGAAPVAT